jgi:glycerophosphoryl diester phosphodiesterase
MKRALKTGAGALAILALLYLILQILPGRGKVPGQNVWRPLPGRRPLVIAHGGGQGLHPPNTLEAFAHSIALGCDALEMDLRVTKDDKLVTLHDETIDRTSDGRGRAIDFTAAELKAKNFGFKFKDPAGTQPYRDTPAHIATLEELFQKYPSTPMIVELKDRGTNGARAAANLNALITHYRRASDVIIASFDDATLNEFRRVSGGNIFTAAAVSTTKAFVLLSRVHLDWFAPTGNQALQIPTTKQGYRLDFPALIRAAHRRNMAVHYWTINEPGEMRRLIDLGADGIMTDRPDLLLNVVGQVRNHDSVTRGASTNTSGNLVPFLLEQITSHGGHPSTNAYPAISAQWRYLPARFQTLMFVDGDCFAEIQAFFSRALGEPDPARGSTPVKQVDANSRMGIYNSAQAGVSIQFVGWTNQVHINIMGGRR